MIILLLYKPEVFFMLQAAVLFCTSCHTLQDSILYCEVPDYI